ncbi:MAG: flagellar hook-basal body complex protein [Roseburia sp.]|nr:flagellar hook-basal body complex protein [Ruminococcus sp.]MCM1156189.1 flagellar hook-basal body complex protein [Roseburia sp.]MCM1241741.1 flagellar hook-basal body complex protein [Roseburia sp.]
MMRSLFSGVAGLKVHQTRMDVIGNNIANVNTTSYKSQSMVFSDLLYQTTQAASAANAETGRGGINARQIGLGAKGGAISTAITTQGSAQSTNNPWDVMITGESFFVVSNGTQNFFTRDGSFKIDGSGNLVMSSTGYTVMGWQVDEATGEILPDTVSALRVMREDNMTYPPESTTKGYMSGIVDKYDTALHSTEGRIVTLSFFDQQGYSYTGKFSIHALDDPGQYYVQLDDILNSEGDSLIDEYNLSSISEVATFGGQHTIESSQAYRLLDTATYIGDNNGVPEYSMKYYLTDMLNGYATNQIVNASASSKNPPKVNLANNAEVKVGDDVTVTGSVELGKSELTAPDFNLIYENEKYYAPVLVQQKDSAGNGVVDAAGNPVMVPDPANKKGVELPVKGTGTDGAFTDAELKLWSDALASFGKNSKITKISVDPSTAAVTMDYELTFTALKAGKYDEEGKYFIGDKIEDPLAAYGLANTGDTTYTISYVTPEGQAQIQKSFTYNGNLLVYTTDKGKFSYIGTPDSDEATLSFNASATSRDGTVIPLTQFTNIDIDFSLSSNVNNGGTSTAGMLSGDVDNPSIGTGRKNGEMTGIEIAQDGKITAYYDNNQSKLLGQIAVANFANASGLSKQGDNLYSATANSGEFDGIGDDITANGGSMTSGVLEMSNVDLSQEFTEMITTQRGFQANSRIITVSDTLLEELVNLKR